MALDPADLPASALTFLGERHLGTLTTMRPDGTPHVVPVGFTWDPDGPMVRVITSRTSRKARNLAEGGRAVVASVDGRRWLSLEGQAQVSQDSDEVAEAVRRYTQRYKPPRANPDRVAILITVDRVLGRAP